jgi:hypothetical protein
VWGFGLDSSGSGYVQVNTVKKDKQKYLINNKQFKVKEENLLKGALSFLKGE